LRGLAAKEGTGRSLWIEEIAGALAKSCRTATT
jgi:hypothetical protein